MNKKGKVTAETVSWSLNPMHPMSGQWSCEKFFGQFERHFPGESGRGLNFFFLDELGFGVSGRIWSAQFAEAFKKRKGHDIKPHVEPGANRIEVMVCNTLANHYTTVPTSYCGSTVSGQLGSVRLELP